MSNKVWELNLSVPGGLKERTDSMNKVDTGYNFGKKINVSKSVYDQMLKDYKKALKETCEVSELLENCVVYDDESMLHIEQSLLIGEAIQESLESGPLFELGEHKAVKKEVRDICKKHRGKIVVDLNDNYNSASKDIIAYLPKHFWAKKMAMGEMLYARAYRLLCIVDLRKGKITDVVDYINKTYKDILSGYSVESLRASKYISDSEAGDNVIDKTVAHYKNAHFILINDGVRSKQIDEMRDKDRTKATKKATKKTKDE